MPSTKSTLHVYTAVEMKYVIYDFGFSFCRLGKLINKKWDNYWWMGNVRFLSDYYLIYTVRQAYTASQTFISGT